MQSSNQKVETTAFGGWPYGYNSYRLDITPFIVPGGENQLAIRIDNSNYSSRMYREVY